MLTQDQRAHLTAQAKELTRWIWNYRLEIARRLARPGPQPETLTLMDTALAKSRTLNSIRWCLFLDTHPILNPKETQ